MLLMGLFFFVIPKFLHVMMMSEMTSSSTAAAATTTATSCCRRRAAKRAFWRNHQMNQMKDVEEFIQKAFGKSEDGEDDTTQEEEPNKGNTNGDETIAAQQPHRLYIPVHKENIEDAKKMVLSFDLPGFHLDDIEIKFQPEDKTLVVNGTRTNRIGDTFVVDKSFVLDSKIFNTERIEADMSDGLLQISIEKNPKPTPRAINISTTKKDD